MHLGRRELCERLCRQAGHLRDNFNKLSLDALSGIVYRDDSQVAELTIKHAYDRRALA